ncbi:radial spoke head protein 3 B-like [Crotalus adamanteus]|uniref:Radial spoke head protein 3 B-like n=1 Tax=Crotalus adamanteus TaxID=8729 RepID=A0AAW1C474_CROAD
MAEEPVGHHEGAAAAPSISFPLQKRRKKQQMEILQKEKETAEKIAARTFAQRYLSDLIPSVFGSLRDSGYFYDPVERDIETGFIPWIMGKMERLLERRSLGRIIADSLIQHVVQMRLQAFEEGAWPEPPEAPQLTDLEVEELEAAASLLIEPSGPLGAPDQPEDSDQAEPANRCKRQASQKTIKAKLSSQTALWGPSPSESGNGERSPRLNRPLKTGRLLNLFYYGGQSPEGQQGSPKDGF